MNGYVTEANQPKVKLKLHNKEETRNFEFLIDTGFDGGILLSSLAAEEMALEPVDIRQVELADGTEKTVPVSVAEIDWYGEKKEIDVLIGGTNAEPLIGTGLIQDSKLLVDFPKRVVQLEKEK